MPLPRAWNSVSPIVAGSTVHSRDRVSRGCGRILRGPVVVVNQLVNVDLADALEVAPAVEVERDAVHAGVFEHGHDAPRDENLPAGGVVVEPGRVVDRLADEVVRVARIDLRDAQVHADPHGDRLAGGRADRLVAVRLLDADRPAGGVDRVGKHEKMAVAGGRDDAAAERRELAARSAPGGA